MVSLSQGIRGDVSFLRVWGYSQLCHSSCLSLEASNIKGFGYRGKASV